MLLNHTQAFAEFDASPVAPHLPVHRPRTRSAFVEDTMLETPHGWQTVQSLSCGDAVSTLDGGFAEITAMDRQTYPSLADHHWHVPAASLNNCSDISLSANQHVALVEPECDTLFGVPCVLAPIAAMAGFRGIRPVAGSNPAPTIDLGFANEEIIYAQTGTLLYVAPANTDPFFRTLTYGETRAVLTLINRGHCAPDTRLSTRARAA